MIIYSPKGEIVLDIDVDDNSYRYRAIRQRDKVFLYYSLSEHVDVPLYSYIEFQGQRYTLWRPENFTKHGIRNLEYILELGSYLELLRETKYKHLSAKPYKLKFSLTGKPRFFLQLLIDNMNLLDSGWTIGTCVDLPEKTLAFSHEFCLDVLSRFADEWDTEYEAIDKTINFGKVERFKNDPLPLSYGRGNGFKTGVGRQNHGDKRPVSILYAEGGDRNINPANYGSTTLLLPKSKELEYQGRRYRTDEDGTYIVRADRPLLNNNEDSYDASHIYPSRIGTVSGVIVVDAENNLYDITDSSIPESLNYSDCRLPEEKAIIIFQSGILTGEEFEIEQTQNDLTGYIHVERKFKLVPVRKNGIVIPNSNRCPAIGDKYSVFNISLPDAYVSDDATKTGASWDMFREMARYMYEHEEETFTFKGELDGIWSKNKWFEIGGKLLPGSYIFFSDTQFQPDGALIRIVGIKDYINRPYSPEIELSNTPVAGFVSSELGKINSNEIKNEVRYQESLNYTKRRWRDAIEAQEMLEKAFDDYSKGVDPVWVRTMSLLVGNENLQFRFVDNKTNPKAVDPNFIYEAAGGVFHVPETILQHMTLGISDIKGKHSASEYKFWDLQAYTSPPLGDFGSMYLYAKCEKNSGSGQFLLSETPHEMDESSYYYFLVGLLGSQFDGTRSFAATYGFTEILPGRITVDRIISTDGKCYFNLGLGEIGGKITFKQGTSGYNNIVDKPDLSVLDEKASDALSAAEDASNVAGGKAKVFYSTSAPLWGMKTNDLWVDGVNIYRYNGLQWVLASKYDNTETEINGGLITTGAISFGGTGGMAGSGNIRIWSGGNSGANGHPPSDPTFRVDKDGNVESRGAIFISNQNGDKLAGFSGNGTADTSVRIWAGNTNPSHAPFKVFQNGNGILGGFSFNQSSMVSTTSGNELFLSGNLLRFKDGNRSRLLIGSDVFPASLGNSMAGPMRIEIDRQVDNMTSGNIGIYFDVYGSINYDDSGYQHTGNNALFIKRGSICGIRPRIRRVQNSQTLSIMDTIIHVIAESDISLTLPSVAEDGQLFIIRKISTGNITIKGRIKNVFKENIISSIGLFNSGLMFIVYDKTNNHWVCNSIDS